MLKNLENPYLYEELATALVLLLYFILRMISAKIVKKYANLNNILEHRSNLVIKYMHLLIGILALLSIVIIWGVRKEQVFLFLSSIFTVVGVAAFAQWSILSNISAGIIIFFSYPFKIGDRIIIHDKDFPIEGEIEDIKAFFIILRSNEGELVTYPNNLVMQKGISVIKSEREQKDFFD